MLISRQVNIYLCFATFCDGTGFVLSFKELTCFTQGGGIPKLVALLSHEAAVAEPAALALGNIAGGESEAKLLVLVHGTVQSILPHMHLNTPLDLLKRCVETYKNIW